MNRLKKIRTLIVFVILSVVLSNYIIIDYTLVSQAANTDATISGTLYSFDKSSNYDIDGYSGTTYSTSSTNSYGDIKISGDITSISNVDGFKAYEVNKDVITISYDINESKLGVVDEEWHIVEDSTKKVNGITLDNKIQNGAIIIQASIDGENWITECTRTNIFSDVSITQSFYNTSDIQQLNGCYFRIIVVYKLGKKDGDSWFFGADEYSYEKYAEVYKFYLIDSESNAADSISPTATPQMNLGSKINTGKDNGYSGEVAIDNKDPHFNWEIGTFFVNGYTRDEYDDITGNPVFLKNVGDNVTLWFNLAQDINCLNGKSNLIISEDTNGYDQQFEVPQTNMGHGTLIIQYTDYNNKAHDPVIYTDYLAANARTGANTRVQLFEEGNYAVALDYEVCNTSGINSYYNYRIYFEFEIRNGNCMVYPFDINNGNELSDMAITENGFKLDMAKSRYLTIDVQRIAISVDSDGIISEDVRFNRPANDGDTFSDEGIYIFTVSNKFTNETTTKTIYVGTNKYLRALSKNQISVSELNSYITEEYTVEDDGTLTAPIVPEPINEEEVIETITDTNYDDTEFVTDEVQECNSDTVLVADSDGISDNSVSENSIDSKNISKWVYIIPIIVIVLILVCFTIKNAIKIKNNTKNDIVKDVESRDKEILEDNSNDDSSSNN